MAVKNDLGLEDFDFGFTAVDESELESVQALEKKAAETSDSALTIQQKLDKMYNAIQPLLTILQKNPEKDYIYWPGRQDKVEEFRDKLTLLYKS